MTDRNKYERGDKIAFQRERERKIVCLGARKISQYRSIVLRNNVKCMRRFNSNERTA